MLLRLLLVVAACGFTLARSVHNHEEHNSGTENCVHLIYDSTSRRSTISMEAQKSVQRRENIEPMNSSGVGDWLVELEPKMTEKSVAKRSFNEEHEIEAEPKAGCCG